MINATGVLLHTNLGRAPLSGAATDAVLAAAGCTDVEFDLTSGTRGRRGRGAPKLPRDLIAHTGSARTPARVRLLGEGPSLVARLTLRDPLPLHAGDRVLLRDPGAAEPFILGATVLRSASPMHPIGRDVPGDVPGRDVPGSDTRPAPARATAAPVPATVPEPLARAVRGLRSDLAGDPFRAPEARKALGTTRRGGHPAAGVPGPGQDHRAPARRSPPPAPPVTIPPGGDQQRADGAIGTPDVRGSASGTFAYT